MKTGRPRIKISATDAVKAEIGRQIKKQSNALLRDRLRAVQLAFDGKGIEALEDAACIALKPFIQDRQRVRSLVGDEWLHTQANATLIDFIPNL